MKRLDLPEAFKLLPNKIQGSGVEVVLLDSASPLRVKSSHDLQFHTLIIILDGSLVVECQTQEVLQKDEAIMVKKGNTVSLTIPDDGSIAFRSIVIFFDEPSLRYALLPFELVPNAPGSNVLKIPLNEKLKVFSDSILMYYNSNKTQSNWTLLLKNKLRELIWIFFHTEIKDQAKQFFSAAR